MMKHYGIVLAGGKSLRMGRDKSLLQRGNQSMLEFSRNLLLNSSCSDVIISRNAPGYIADVIPDMGPCSGLHAGLKQLPDSGWLTVLPVDMPLMTSEQLKRLQSEAETRNCAVYFQASVMPFVVPISAALKRFVDRAVTGDAPNAIKALLAALQAQAIPFEHSSVFINTNSTVDWQDIQSQLNL